METTHAPGFDGWPVLDGRPGALDSARHFIQVIDLLRWLDLRRMALRELARVHGGFCAYWLTINTLTSE